MRNGVTVQQSRLGDTEWIAQFGRTGMADLGIPSILGLLCRVPYRVISGGDRELSITPEKLIYQS
jgi:hypothetical protein